MVVKKIEKELDKEKSKATRRKVYKSIGRRKESVAQVKLTNGKGNIKVNGKSLEDYFSYGKLKSIVKRPLEIVSEINKLDLEIRVRGGGSRGQAEAIQHGISRALVSLNKDFRLLLKKEGYLRRDPRMKERKKYGLKKARRAPQWQKR